MLPIIPGCRAILIKGAHIGKEVKVIKYIGYISLSRLIDPEDVVNNNHFWSIKVYGNNSSVFYAEEDRLLCIDDFKEEEKETTNSEKLIEEV